MATERLTEAAEAHRRAMVVVECAALATFVVLLGVLGSKWFKDTIWG
jgi:hypothetical protein